ncbi:hypothetical protein QAD02_016437 [Eretmocerus hayati]|uniref:Uncharacterized protein n=1 Tax=Eretmocerus hayati TaxID=131215 RepID=A0ACC2PAK5_9HYME|nr:hypothetical protein QAD02_016437 [Eretmocerus hayati]
MLMNKIIPYSIANNILAFVILLIAWTPGSNRYYLHVFADTRGSSKGELVIGGNISATLRLDNGTLGKINNGYERVLFSVTVSNSTSIAPALPEVRSLFGTSDNATSEAPSTEDQNGEKPEELPEALELRYPRPSLAGPGNKYRRRPIYSPPITRRPPVNRRNVYHDKPSRNQQSSIRPTRRPSLHSQPAALDPKRAPTDSECTFFSETVCLQTIDYPMDAIMRSIRNNKDMVVALLADFKVPESALSDDDDENEDIDVPSSSYKTSYDHRYDKRYENRFETSNEIKRKYEFSGSSALDNVEEGFTCPSQVKYARPQLARAASGLWKYIINTGEHTQTLRLEKCSSPKASCSFISEHYRSSCMQVYNYHRLLTWDSKLGLHMDIFKVPTCCSCHVHGYTDLYPPHETDPPLRNQETFPGADFVTRDHHGKGSSHGGKYGNSLDSASVNLFRDNYGSLDSEETQLQHSSSARRPSVIKPPRLRKPSGGVKPFDKLPQQHAPNTRAPGYKGPSRPHRPNRPFRRDSGISETADSTEVTNNSTLNRFNQAFDQDVLEPNLRFGFDDEYQEPQRRVNYNYHPIIDFFKPEAALLKAEEPIKESASTSHTTRDTWKPIFKH